MSQVKHFPSLPKQYIPIGGRLKHFTNAWYNLTKDQEVIQMTKACEIQIHSTLPTVKIPHDLIRSEEEVAFAKDHIQELLQKRAIVPSEREIGDFISSIFLVPKKNSTSKFRMILNLKEFNEYAVKLSFKMETLQHILSMVTPNMYMMNIDIVDAYLVVPMSMNSSCYLKFSFQGKIFKYIVLPFGYTGSPKIFTKILKPIIARLRSAGFQVSFYLDNSWQGANTYKESLKCCIATFTLLQECGFVPNLRKSNLIPSQKIEILGAIVDSVEMCVKLPKSKEGTVIQLITLTLEMKNMTIRHLARVIGKLISCTVACPLGNAYFRSLEHLKVRALNRNEWNWNCKIRLNADAKLELNWWLNNLPNCAAPIARGPPTKTVFSDACFYGWGMVFNNMTANGHFSESELPFSINTKETLAIYYGFWSFKKYLRNSHIHFQSDSTTAISYVRKMGGMNLEIRSKIARDLWTEVTNVNSWLSISHIAGRENLQVDIASRVLCERTQWMLNPLIFKKCCEHFKVQPTVDLFASRLNAQCDRYFSFTPDPYCSHVDSFTASWKKEKLPYIFPPFNILHRCLAKIKQEEIKKVLLVCPAWPNQPFFGTMLNMLVELPLLLPANMNDILMLPWDLTMIHPNLKNLKLLLVVLSGIDTHHKEFQKKLSAEYSQHGNQEHQVTTQLKRKGGTCFAANGKSIPCTHLNFN